MSDTRRARLPKGEQVAISPLADARNRSAPLLAHALRAQIPEGWVRQPELLIGSDIDRFAAMLDPGVFDEEARSQWLLPFFSDDARQETTGRLRAVAMLTYALQQVTEANRSKESFGRVNDGPHEIADWRDWNSKGLITMPGRQDTVALGRTGEIRSVQKGGIVWYRPFAPDGWVAEFTALINEVRAGIGLSRWLLASGQSWRVFAYRLKALEPWGKSAATVGEVIDDFIAAFDPSTPDKPGRTVRFCDQCGAPYVVRRPQATNAGKFRACSKDCLLALQRTR